MIGAGDLELRAPIPGESLDGFIADIVGSNDLIKVRTISAVGGIAYGHRPQLTTMGWKGLPALAEILEVDVEELRLRSYPTVAGDGSRRAFFGTTVHAADLRTRERFFSPSALAASPHHRAIWQLRLPYDPETGDLLTCRCQRLPICGVVQRWRHSAGVAHCDRCVHDLSLQQVPRLGAALLPDYRLAVGLTHTEPDERAASLATLPDRLRAMGADMAFELLLRLCPVLDEECRWTQGSRLWSNPPEVIASAMQRAWKVLVGWPSALLDTIGHDLGTAGARFGDGKGGATNRFFRLRHGEGVAPAVAAEIAAVHAMIDVAHSGAIPCQEASAITGISTRVLVPMRREGVFRTIPVARGPFLLPYLDRGEMQTVHHDIKRRWDLSRAAPVLGLPYYAVERLCALRHIELLTHAYFDARYPEPQTTKAAIDDTVATFAAAARPSLRGGVPILEAMRMVGGRLKPWDAVIEALLSGIDLPFTLKQDAGSLFDRIRVRREDLLRVTAAPITAPSVQTPLSARMNPAFRFADRMTKCDAGEVLNIRTRQFTPLLAKYPTSSARVVPVADVLRLASAYISSTEIAERLRVPYQRVRGRMSAHGIVAISEAGFCRTTVERLLASEE